MPLIYKKVDLTVVIGLENKVIVEVKAIKDLDDVHPAQVLSYRKLSKCKLGLLINFNVILLRNGIKRIVNKL